MNQQVTGVVRIGSASLAVLVFALPIAEVFRFQRAYQEISFDGGHWYLLTGLAFALEILYSLAIGAIAAWCFVRNSFTAVIGLVLPSVATAAAWILLPLILATLGAEDGHWTNPASISLFERRDDQILAVFVCSHLWLISRLVSNGGALGAWRSAPRRVLISCCLIATTLAALASVWGIVVVEQFGFQSIPYALTSSRYVLPLILPALVQLALVLLVVKRWRWSWLAVLSVVVLWSSDVVLSYWRSGSQWNHDPKEWLELLSILSCLVAATLLFAERSSEYFTAGAEAGRRG